MKTFKEFLNEEEHYSDLANKELIKLGWKLTKNDFLEKQFAGASTGGQLNPGGKTIISMSWEEPSLRWLVAHSGFEEITEFDGRDSINNAKKFAKTVDDTISKKLK